MIKKDELVRVGKKGYILAISGLMLILVFTQSNGQIAQDKCKFLGNVIANSTPANFNTYWNQVTPENAGKWGSVESTRDIMDWSAQDNAYQHAKENGYIFKAHTFVWGSQYPGWISSLSQEEQLEEIEEWIKAYCEKYPETDMIDVVNEPINAAPGATNGNFMNALGGGGITGYDWIIKSFEMAREYCPNAQLLINEYNILNGYTSANQYKGIVELLKERDLIDGVGLQSHGLEDIPTSTIESNLEIMASTGVPLYISEYEARGDDQTQLDLYEEQFPIFWENEAIHGVTLWGYIDGQMWRNEGHLVKSNGTERPAMKWLKEYVNSSIGGFFCYDVTGFDDESNSNYEVYPNPAESLLNLEWEKEFNSVKIVNLDGKLMKELSTDSTKKLELNLDIPPGIYIVQLSNELQSVFKKITVR